MYEIAGFIIVAAVPDMLVSPEKFRALGPDPKVFYYNFVWYSTLSSQRQVLHGELTLRCKG